MTTGDVLGATLRSVHVTTLVSLFGTLVFSAVALRGMPASAAMNRVRARLTMVLRVSIALAFLSGAAWLAERTCVMANAQSPEGVVAALPMVIVGTRFGQLLMLRGALLLMLSVLLSRPRAWSFGGVLAGVALALQAATSHAGAMAGGVGNGLVLAEVLHVLAAGAWLGALVPLLLVLAYAPAEATAQVQVVGRPLLVPDTGNWCCSRSRCSC